MSNQIILGRLSIMLCLPNVMEQKNGQCVIELKVQNHHRGGGGTDSTNGGVLSYMVDAVLGGSVHATYGKENCDYVTLHLNISYIHPLKGNIAMAQGRVYKQGKSIAFADGEIYDENKTPCVKASGVFRVYQEQ
jgi:uncharacterized protein (TIGR00369 family)